MTKERMWRKALNHIQDAVTHPSTKRFANAGSKILNVASQIGQAKLGAPLSIAGAVIGLLDVVSNHTQSGFYNSVYDTAGKHGLLAIDISGAISLLFEQGRFQNSQVLVNSEHGSLVSIDVGDQKIAVVLNKDGQLQGFWPAFIDKHLTTSSIAAMLWESLGNYITLTFRRDKFGYELLTAATIVCPEELPYIGPNDPAVLTQRFKRYHTAGISRAVLAVGPPGTGKTTFGFRCAQELGGRMMVITPELLENQNLPRQDIVDIVGAFKPAVLMFEDVDRVKNDGLLLSLMDYVRRGNRETLMISTANDHQNIVDALKRPGRLGPRLEFPSPDLKLRQQLIRLYSEKIGIDRDISDLAEVMEHPKFSHDYVRDVCEQALIESNDELRTYIERIKSDFDANGGSGPEKPAVK